MKPFSILNKEQVIERIKELKREGGSVRYLGQCEVTFDDRSMTVEWVGGIGDDLRRLDSPMEHLGLPTLKELKSLFKYSEMCNPEKVYNIIFEINQ